MARLLALCSLPRTNQGDRLQYIRRNGPLTLVMTAGFKTRLPYGTLPRLLLAWECTEAVRTQSRDLILGDSLAAFMRKLEIYNDGGAVRGRVQDQMRRLFNSHVQLVLRRCPRPSERVFAGGRSDRALVEPETARRSHAVGKFDQAWGRIFNEVIRNPVPLDLHILHAVKRSPLGLDLYLWLTYRTFNLKRPLRLWWSQLSTGSSAWTRRRRAIEPPSATSARTVSGSCKKSRPRGRTCTASR